jgi:putative GTP pyrophosphokinase
VKNEDFDAWWRKQRPLYEKLACAAKLIVEESLREQGIPYVAVFDRAKAYESAVEKAARKEYSNPIQEITDFAGIRIVTRTQTEADSVSGLLPSIFDVDSDKSGDHSKTLLTDRIGYRSVHFICKLGSQRCRLLDYRKFDSLVFEVQVRTMLMHAWAEIAHAKSYKQLQDLPPDLARGLNLISGLLEVADSHIVNIAKSIDEYRARFPQKPQESNTLTPQSVSLLLRQVQPRFRRTRIQPLDKPEKYLAIIEELKRFGIGTLSEFEALIDTAFVAAMDTHVRSTADAGFCRDLMMFSDLDKYFRDSYQKSWNHTDEESLDALTEKYSTDSVLRWMRHFDILVYSERSSNEIYPSLRWTDLIESTAHYAEGHE